MSGHVTALNKMSIASLSDETLIATRSAVLAAVTEGVDGAQDWLDAFDDEMRRRGWRAPGE